jgi:hypothetical protein
MSPITSSRINGLPFISGNALPLFPSTTPVEVFRSAYPEFADSIIVKKIDHADYPFGGHTISFTTSEAECWFRLKHG